METATSKLNFSNAFDEMGSVKGAYFSWLEWNEEQAGQELPEAMCSCMQNSFAAGAAAVLGMISRGAKPEVLLEELASQLIESKGLADAGR